MNEKVVFNLTISFDKDYEVVANGKLMETTQNDSLKTWKYGMKKPMSSYLVALAIRKYNKKSMTSTSGVPIELYYYPEDSLKFEPTYRYTKQMFDFFEEEIGVPYPWQNYKQVPVKDFLYSGMENTTLTIFSDRFVVDSIAFIDENYVNVNAHELAHQWFGNLVTAKTGTHHWLQEGFATYYALLAEKEIFGSAYYSWKLSQSYRQLIKKSNNGQGESLLDPKASSLTFYEKGAWALHILRQWAGNEAFKKSVKNYLQKHQFNNVTTTDFISEVEKVSGRNLEQFVKKWLDQKEFPNVLDEIASFGIILTYSKDFYILRQNLMETPQVFSSPEYKEMLTTAFMSNDIKTRQLIALTLDSIPLEFKTDFESLLNDKSYVTIEQALLKLWLNFSEERVKYLNQTKNIIGSNDRNVRILWLALMISDSNSSQEEIGQFYLRLAYHTAPVHSYQIRLRAFQVISQLLNSYSPEVIVNLVDGAKHHNWRFAKYCSELLKNIFKEDTAENRFLKNEISNEHKIFIENLLNKK